jgi:hypothetical protein
MRPEYAAARAVRHGRGRESCHAGIKRNDALILIDATVPAIRIGGLS